MRSLFNHAGRVEPEFRIFSQSSVYAFIRSNMWN